MVLCRFAYSPANHLSFPKYPPKYAKLPSLPLSAAWRYSTSTMEAPPEGYRKNVGICLINDQKKVQSLTTHVIRFSYVVNLNYYWSVTCQCHCRVWCPYSASANNWWFLLCRFFRLQGWIFRIHGKCHRWFIFIQLIEINGLSYEYFFLQKKNYDVYKFVIMLM